jgi:hypothetical protein
MDAFNETRELIVPKVDLIVVGRLGIGKEGEHQIKSSLKTDEQIEEYAGRLGDKFVEVEEAEAKCAVCMDGRGCHCLASDVRTEPNGELWLPDYKKPPVRLKVIGGLFDMATMMAVLGGWSGLRAGTNNYNDAREQVVGFLTQLGYRDGAHTSDVSFVNPNNTECGGWMKKKVAMEKGAATWEKAFDGGTPSALDEAIAAYNGVSAEQLVQHGHVIEHPQADAARRNYQMVRHAQAELAEHGFFDAFNPVALRNQMRQEVPDRLELLYSDPNHPTHNHKEPALLVVDGDNPRVTLDRDALYQADGAAPFVDNRNLRRQLSHIMGGSDEERLRLLIAGDVATVDPSDELVAPGMPVILANAA